MPNHRHARWQVTGHHDDKTKRRHKQPLAHPQEIAEKNFAAQKHAEKKLMDVEEKMKRIETGGDFHDMNHH